MKEIKYYKNEMQEIIFENLDYIKEGDNVILRLKDGDLTSFVHIYYLLNNVSLFILGDSLASENNASFEIIAHLREKKSLKIYFFDKITTTNSTGMLEVQNSDRLEVIDCIEFFK